MTRQKRIERIFVAMQQETDIGMTLNAAQQRGYDDAGASVTAHRNVAFAELDFEDIKTVKNYFGVKVNDVVMALVAGVLRQYLLDRDELPESSLVAMVPVSVHDRSDRPGRNQVSGMFTKLETHIADPAERLKAIAEANTTAKEHSSAIGATSRSADGTLARRSSRKVGSVSRTASRRAAQRLR